MTDTIKIDIPALQNFISQYKAAFSELRLGAYNEIYKWKAVKCFQDNWDINADDFHTMVKSSLEQTYNLLASQNNFPGKMIEAFSKAAPEEVRSILPGVICLCPGVLLMPLKNLYLPIIHTVIPVR